MAALYRILEGVHRCVAAREAGLTEVRARIDRGGGLGLPEMVELSALFSPKSEIGRWDRGRDFHVLIGMIGDPTVRPTIPPVELTPVAARVAKYLTPIADVVVRNV